MSDIRARPSPERIRPKAWAESYRLLEAADREGPLEPDDLERLATAAYLIGRDAESETFSARAHQKFLDRGDREGAARCAGWLGFELLQRGAIAPASGWFARAERILDEAHLDCVVRGYLLIPSAIQRIVQGDPAAGDATFARAAEIARRFGDRALASLACSGRGRAMIRLGNVAEGVALLDEAMVAVIAGDVAPHPCRRHLLHRPRGVSGDVRSAACLRVDDVARRMVRRSARPGALSRRVPALSRRGHAAAREME